MYLISDNIDTWTGMRLAGVEGAVVHEKEELKAELDKVLADKTIGIVLLTEKFGREFPDLHRCCHHKLRCRHQEWPEVDCGKHLSRIYPTYLAGYHHLNEE